MNNGQTGKIIPFPGVEYRLLEKGAECLQAGEVDRAIEWLEEADKFNDSDPEIAGALTAAYCKKGHFRKAKDSAKRLFEQRQDFESMGIYLSILLELHEYKTAQTLLTMMMETRAIPPGRVSQYEALAELLGTLLKRGKNSVPKHGLFDGDIQEIIGRVKNLAPAEVDFYLDEIREYLQEEEGHHPFIKTLICNLLLEGGKKDLFMVRKYGQEMSFDPTHAYFVTESPFAGKVREEIRNLAEMENPGLAEYARILADRFFFQIYPFESRFEDESLWAMAFLAVARQYLNIPASRRCAPECGEEPEEEIRFILQVEKDFPAVD